MFTHKIIIRVLIISMFFGTGVLFADTQQEIDHLLGFVASSECEYDRNGTVHSGPEARDHINMKYEYYKKKVKTAEDFVKYSATKSKLSGRHYKIRCPEREVMDASEWLLNELQAYRAGEHID
jgi:hypothetical protein